MFPDHPMKYKRVRKEPVNMEEPTSTVQAPASLLKGKCKHTNSVVEVRKASNASKVQPSEALHQCEVKKVKLMPKLSRTYSAPNPLRISSSTCSNPKVKDGTAESDPGDLDEDGEDCDEQDSLDDEDEDEELADLAIENFGEEKSTSNQVNTALDDESEDEDSMGLEKATKIRKSKSTTREKKLQDEMPHFADDTEQKPLTALAVNSGASDTASLNGTTSVWLPDTDLQLEKVCKVIRGSYEQGQRMFSCGLEDDVDLTIDNVFAMTTAFATCGTETLAYEALVESADHEGYTGDNDMAECLLSDSWAQYAKLLIDYTTRRIHLCHNQFKKAVSVVVTSVLNLVTNFTAQNLLLLEDINYIYPCVATAVEACILDFTIGKSSKFVSPSHDNMFQAHMLLLTMKQKKLLEYHKLTRGIYCAVIGMRSVGSARLLKEQIIVQVDWANMGSESD
ncbi:uncharacterized protein EDB93DRAFT_1256657 [Suillus bovinus]|uniref:uncharacterized protein n=1 Tax=Suillus bovinus TaxID=48563 RepID=UPI001B869AF0|nr:uncharacterized protein EDB93DRAFT_1256657 [Suillus bovinus]KAG2128535.1 hypothetical protein EDB93DRAFT_1256657 [Suillus bovinus]